MDNSTPYIHCIVQHNSNDARIINNHIATCILNSCIFTTRNNVCQPKSKNH